MITQAKASGDAILISSNPSDPASGVSLATQQGYVDDMKAMAITNNIPFIDVWRLFGGSFAAANASGYAFDDRHPSGAGYTQISTYLAQALTPGFRSI
jgi:lysophospholipase L1-like esterase